MIIISHDRQFLDKICTHIVNTERGKSRTYLGNYSSYLEQRSLEEESVKASFDRQQKKLSSQQEFIDRFRASATRSTQAKSREKLIDKLELIKAPETKISNTKFCFSEAPRSGKEIAIINDLSLTYGEKIIF